MCPGGEIGRRTGLKILGPLKSCGFKSRPGHKKSHILLNVAFLFLVGGYFNLLSLILTSLGRSIKAEPFAISTICPTMGKEKIFPIAAAP